MTVKTLAFDVDWHDSAANSPRLLALTEGLPVRDADTAYEKHAIADDPGWHVYYSDFDGYVWFFTWGGKPDDGFGGWKRTVTLSDGTTETVIGGWHASSDCTTAAGLPRVMSVVTTRNETESARWPRSGSSGFMTVERVERELPLLRPDLELVATPWGMTVKWRGQPSKDEHIAKRTRVPYSSLGPVGVRDAV